uniref:Tc1-like transposase DDE domain-containing protein n=1 Tax=Oncorhynchus tshawytscha TaxID=74940 RepID=A0AAZ3QJA2_ONCTS
MTMPPAILLVLCVISCKTGMPVFCTWPATSPDLNPIEHVWDLLDRRVRARAIPPRNVRELARAIPPRNVRELAGALVEEWGNSCIKRYRLLLLIFTPLPLIQGHIIPFVSHMSVEPVQFMSQLCSYKYLQMLSLLKINAVDSERTFLFC